MITLLHQDCMTYMAGLPDKAFELAIVDPPYGIGIGTAVGGVSRLVTVGGERLSRPKSTGGSMILESPIKNTSMSCSAYRENRLFLAEITFLTTLTKHRASSFGIKTIAETSLMQSWRGHHSKRLQGFINIGGTECCRAI